MNKGIVLLTGLSGAGKTTIAKKLTYDLILNYNINAIHIDGDEFRKYITPDLGFSLEDRLENITRLSNLCELLLTNDVLIILSFITPTIKSREILKNINDIFYEVYINCPIDECIKRNPKGLYGKNIKNFTGISQQYEVPTNPDIEIKTNLLSIDESVNKIINNFNLLR